MSGAGMNMDEELFSSLSLSLPLSNSNLNSNCHDITLYILPKQASGIKNVITINESNIYNKLIIIYHS